MFHDDVTGITLVHCKEDPCDILICRGSPWGNPFSHKESKIAKYHTKSRKESVDKFREWVRSSDEPEAVWIRDHIEELRGQRLGCFCKGRKKQKLCHGEVYIEMLTPSPFEDFFE